MPVIQVVPSWLQLMRFEDHPCSCLAVSFAPWDPQLLVFAEAKIRVYITG